MTLQTRNHSFKAGIIISAVALGIMICAVFTVLSAYPEAMEKSSYRSVGLIQGFVTGRAETYAYTPFFSTLGAVLFSLITISIIRFSFMKTQSEEIFYIGLFVMSMSIECFRTLVPFKTAFEIPSMYLYISSRFLIFSRCFGMFSLFAASLCAAGLKTERQRNVFFSVSLVAMVIALGIPVDGLSWDSTLNVHSGYASTFLLIEAGLPIATVLNFLVAAYNRSTREFITISLGILMVFVGRDILLHSDTIITPIPGILILSAGTWLVCTRLHRVYLWI